ncbi:hypothetical protein AMJ80_05630 [bacterium SM23_31]|nr:MAG: hypothetical protein AMJ80_05630 [bacterium SM23_31]
MICKIRCLSCLFVLSLFLIPCCSESDLGEYGREPVLTGVLTLELTFGAENLNEDYLLARPENICVNDYNDILVLDEDRIKVFYENGREKTIFGRPGLGPGEFISPQLITGSPTGVITVLDGRGINIFSPAFKYITTIKPGDSPKFKNLIEEHYLQSPTAEKIMSFSENERVSEYTAVDLNVSSDFPGHHLLVYEKDSLLTKLAQYPDPGYLAAYRGPRSRASQLLRFRGDFYWAADLNKRIVYVHSRYNRIIENGRSKYILHIVPLETLEETTIIHSYPQIELSDSIKNQFKNPANIPARLRDPGILNKIMDEEKYYPALHGLFVDKGFIFVFTYEQNNAGEYVVNIFDINTAVYVRSTYFSFVPGVIKNGYAYRTNTDDEGFSIIQKYKIDPAVYGK